VTPEECSGELKKSVSSKTQFVLDEKGNIPGDIALSDSNGRDSRKIDVSLDCSLYLL
jgi:hypothetical protein